MGVQNSVSHEHKPERLLNVQGSSMDKRVVVPKTKTNLVKWLSLASLLAVASWFVISQVELGRTQTLDAQRVVVSKATVGVFEDYIPIRAQVVPLKTVFLDAVQGGRVEEVLIEDGATVKRGQPLIRLSNSDLQLSVMSTESRVMEQLNAMRDQELRLEQNRLAHKRAIAELNFQIKKLTREQPQKQRLIASGHISKTEYDNFVDELAYLTEKRNITIESQKSDERLMETQMTFFREKAQSMEANLAFAKQSLEELLVRSPVDGRLSGFDTEVGQSVTRGQRIGQVSHPDAFKFEAMIDEFYLSRTSVDLMASVERNNSTYSLVVSKVYPDVRDGQFQIDMKAVDALPKNLRRGQTLQSKLILGDENEALMIPNGPFMQDTGGKWVFVVDQDNKATKREITLGRKNNRFVEVLSGLREGERVLTSTYSQFKDMDTLSISER